MPVITKDVTVLVGMSPSAVNRTCKNRLSISYQTKERMHQAIAKLGYEPSFRAGSLATQNSRTIDIILPPSEWEAYRNTSYLEVIHGINQYCNQGRYVNTVIAGQNEEEILQAIKSMVRTGLAGGLIVLYSREQDLVLDYLYKEGILHVLVGKAYRNMGQAIYVDNNNVLAGKETAEYLLELGHERIAYLPGGYSLLLSNNRRMGYMLALAERGTGFLPGPCVEVPSVPEKQNKVLHALLTHTDGPTAVLVSDDIPAVTLGKGCMKLGLSILRDVFVISFNNSFLAGLTVPSLTSVDVNSCQLGTRAATQMIEHVGNPELVATKIIVSHRLVERDSCAVYKRP